MRSPSTQDRAGWPWYGWALAGIAGAALLAAALWLCVVVLPQRLYPPLSAADLAGLSPAEQAERREGRDNLQNDVRTTLLQGLAALLVLAGAGIGAAVTLRQVRVGREQLEVARQQAHDSDRQAREQLEVARQGQVTERFTRAIDQLGSGQLDIRLGGIYALASIAHDSDADRPTIAEVLTAYVRTHSPWPPAPPGQAPADLTSDQLRGLPDLRTRAPDVQAALTMLSRGGFAGLIPPAFARLNLRAADLRNADLRGENLEGADLRGAHLEGADLNGADLVGAKLGGAHLEGADLNGADLVGAKLGGAHLGRAALREATLGQADFGGAYLEEADFGGASLKGADLGGAHLEGANLNGADLVGTKLGGAHLKRANLGYAHLEEAYLRGADLAGAYLGDASLKGATLGGAHLEGANLRGADLAGAFLMDAHLEGADLRSADLEGADLGTTLEPVPLHGSNLEGMGLGGADLEEVGLGGATLKQQWVIGSAHLRGARADDSTRWPDGFDWQAAGVTLDLTMERFEVADKAAPTTPQAQGQPATGADSGAGGEAPDA